MQNQVVGRKGSYCLQLTLTGSAKTVCVCTHYPGLIPYSQAGRNTCVVEMVYLGMYVQRTVEPEKRHLVSFAGVA